MIAPAHSSKRRDWIQKYAGPPRKNQVVIFFESKSAAAANPCIEPPPEKNSEPEINETTNRNQTT